jgi:plastocyanin
LELALGVLWLLDGLLQFQPFMFKKEFFEGILGMANMGLPGPVSMADYRMASVLVTHPAMWNALFASLQVAIGVGLIYKRTARVALAVSIPWALGVWTIGEGFGGLFMGSTSLLTGAPGAALLYAVLGVLLWPGLRARLGDNVGKAAWLVAWAGSALLELRTVNHTPGVPGAQIANGRFGEPAWLGWLNDAAGHLVGRHGTEFALALGAAGVLVGFGVLWGSSRRAALTAGTVIAISVGVLGQDLGGIATGHGTDPGSGPLLVLLALALWPARQPTHADRPIPCVGTPRSRPRLAPARIGRSLVPVGIGTDASRPTVSTGTQRMAFTCSALVVLGLLLITACAGGHHAATSRTTTSAAPTTAATTSVPTGGHTTVRPSKLAGHSAAKPASEAAGPKRTVPAKSATSGPTAAPPALPGAITASTPPPGPLPPPRTLPPSTTPRTTPPKTVPTPSPPTTGAHITVMLTIRNFAFSPASVTITAGTTVKVTNDDQVVHTWTSTSAPVVFNSNDLNASASYRFTFTVPGIYHYQCSIHTFMTGTIAVTG